MPTVSLPSHVPPLPPPSSSILQVFSGLAPATNYTVLLSVGSGSILVGTVVVVSGVLTPDTNAPTFEAVGPMQV